MREAFFPINNVFRAGVSLLSHERGEYAALRRHRIDGVLHHGELARAADILSDPSKYDPRTKETADHSLPYVIAAAIVDRQVTPAQFEMKKIMDPAIRAQLKKVEVVADPEIEKVFPALQRVVVNITTIEGRTFSKQLDYPKGDPRNPLTDAEVEEKFAALAEGVLSAGAQKKLIDTIWSLEKVGSVSKLMALMKADVKLKKPASKKSG